MSTTCVATYGCFQCFMFEQMMGGLEWELQCPKFIGESSLELAGLYTGFFLREEKSRCAQHAQTKGVWTNARPGKFSTSETVSGGFSDHITKTSTCMSILIYVL